MADAISIEGGPAVVVGAGEEGQQRNDGQDLHSSSLKHGGGNYTDMFAAITAAAVAAFRVIACGEPCMDAADGLAEIALKFCRSVWDVSWPS